MSSPVVVGSGLAGLVTALDLAAAGTPCHLVCAGDLGTASSSELAQGGLAAALTAQDCAADHARDTLAAGAGLCDVEAVEAITAGGADAVALLLGLGARFDRSAGGELALGLEGAHGRARIVHAGGDATGAEIVRAVRAAVAAHPLITASTGHTALDVETVDGQVHGVFVRDDATGEITRLATSAVVLATGGIGGLFAHTTNPVTSWGSGLALALRAGAVLRDVELVQFHPTALDVGGDPMSLVSEAVRGAGARLVLADGSPAVPDSLAARDVVARGVWAHLEAGRPVFLDVASALGDQAAARFPTLARACLAAGLDPARDLVPIRPAAHYHMGGVEVDRRGLTCVPGLWAVGEVASTGLHGANRLASNSLLEAVVCARWVAADIANSAVTSPALTTVDRGGRDASGLVAAPAGVGRSRGIEHAASDGRARRVRPPDAELRREVESVTGVLRHGGNLAATAARLREPARHDDAHLVALAVVEGALARAESRGAHTRLDVPATSLLPQHTRLTLADLLGTRLTDRSAS